MSIASGTPPAPGAGGSFGWRIIATFTTDRIKLSLYVDILGFVLGPARVTLVRRGAAVELRETDSGRVLSSAPMTSASRIEIVGRSGAHDDTLTIDLSGGPASVLELPSCEDVGLPSREGSDASVHSTQL